MALTNPFAKYKTEPNKPQEVSEGNPFAKYRRPAGMGAPEDNLAVDSEKVQMAQAQMRTEGTNQPVGEPGFVGGVKELGKGIARGAAVTVPEMAGKALEWFDPEGGDTAVSDYGRSMVKSAEQRLKDNPSLQQSALADVKSEDSAFSLRGKAGEGGEMLAPSMGAPLAGAGIGFALGGPPGAAIGAAGGFLASLPLYFGSQAQDTYERVKPEQLKKAAQAGLTGQAADEFAHDEAWKAGVLTGGIEAGGEAIADRVTFGLFRLLPRKIKSDLVRSATKGLRGPGELAKDFAKIVAAETGTELAQGAGQQEVEQAYGVGEGASWESTKGVILPTIILSAMTFGAAEPVGAMQRRALNKVLANPEADPAQRQAAVEAVGQAVGQQDPELGKLWMESATAQLAKGEAIVANEDEYYRNLGVEPDAPEEEKAQAVKQAVGTPMPISPMEAGLLPNAGPLTRAVAAGGQAPASPAADYRGIGDQEAAQQAQADMQATATQEADSELKALRKERSDLAGIKTKGQQAAAAKRIEEIDKRVLELTGNATEQKPEKQAEPGKTDETPKTGLDRPATKSIRQQEAEAAAQEKPEQKRGILEELAPVPAPETETKTETAEQKRQRLIDEKKRRPAPEPAAPAVQMTPAQGVTIDETPPGPVAEDPRMKRETYRGALKQMVSELTEGGGIAIVPKDGAKPTSDTGDVIYDYGNQEITRTPSINPDWFKRWDIEVGKKPTVKEVRTAVEKALAGEKLGKPQERIIRGLLDNIEGERTEPPSMEAAKAERDQQRETRKEGFGGKRAEAPQLPGAEQDPGIKLLDDAISEAQRLGVSQKRIDYLLEQGAQTDEAPAELAKYIKHESGQAKKGIPPFLRDDYEPTTSGIKGETDEQVAARKAEREGEFPGEPQTEADTATSPRPIPPIDDAGGIPALEQEEIDRAAGPRPIAITDELDVDQAAPALELQPQTIEDLERLQQEEEARADAQRQEAQKAEADANLGGFTLTGSNRPADEAAAAGQTSLLDITDQPEAAAKPETVTEPETVTKPTKITLPELPFKPEQLEGVTMFVEWETENDMGRDDFQASWLLSQSERRLDMLNKLGECLVK